MAGEKLEQQHEITVKLLDLLKKASKEVVKNDDQQIMIDKKVDALTGKLESLAKKGDDKSFEKLRKEALDALQESEALGKAGLKVGAAAELVAKKLSAATKR